MFNINEKQMKFLLESTNAIPWVIDWPTKIFSYIGPQIEKLLGYPRQSWVDANVWSERIHQEDRERVVNYCISHQRMGKTTMPTIVHWLKMAVLYGFEISCMWCENRV